MAKYFILRMDRSLKKVLLEALKVKGWKLDTLEEELLTGESWPHQPNFLAALRPDWPTGGRMSLGWVQDDDSGLEWINSKRQENSVVNMHWAFWTALAELPMCAPPPPPEFSAKLGSYKVTVADDGTHMMVGCLAVTKKQVEEYHLALQKRSQPDKKD